MRVYETGATRDAAEGKLDYRGFLSPVALERFAQYMQKHRVQADGELRASDNWKKGIPIQDYVTSGVRHTVDFWRAVDESRWSEADDLACAIFFNIQGYLHERMKLKEPA